MANTALVVLVPEAEPIISGVRSRYDPSVLLEVPAHVTLLFPFMPPHAVSTSVSRALRSLFAGFESFSACFAEACRWPQEAYLPPQPNAPFIALTRCIAAAYPEYPPYEGRHVDIVPHLTVAQGSAAAAEQGVKEMGAVLAGAGPIQTICRAATLLENSGGPWRVMQSFPFSRNTSADMEKK